jgi:transcriptional regulator GlxA family with amidase domain
MITVLPIAEIKKRLHNMRENRRRGYSMAAFAKLAGVDYRNMKKAFFELKMPVSETTQRRISKALQALEDGQAGMLMDIAGRMILDYHPPKEFGKTLKRGYTLELTNGKIGLSVKPINKYDYTKPPLLKK